MKNFIIVKDSLINIDRIVRVHIRRETSKHDEKFYSTIEYYLSSPQANIAQELEYQLAEDEFRRLQELLIYR